MAQTKEGAIKGAAVRLGISVGEYREHLEAGEKWCYKCATWRPHADFVTDRSRWDGLKARCAACDSTRRRVGPTTRERRLHRAQGLAWCRGCGEWKSAVELRGGVCRTHKNMELRVRYARDPEHRRQWRERVHARSRSIAPMPAKGMDTILDEFGDRCAYCGHPATSWDHIVPVSKGGKTVPWNMVPACAACNSSKNDRDLEEWLIATGKTLSNEVIDRMALEWTIGH